jgi:hypothetical protein
MFVLTNEVVSKLVSNYLVTTYGLPLISIRDFKMKKKIAEEFIKIEQGVMEAYLVNQITVGTVSWTFNSYLNFLLFIL